MNPAKQFWALFKFQSSVNPFLWVLPLAFGFPVLLPLFHGSLPHYHESFYLLLFNQGLVNVGIFGAMILAPERIFFGNANLTSGYYGTEFILTRAVDRPVFYRARAALFYLLVLLLPVFGVLNSVAKPDLFVAEYSPPVQQACLAAVPGSTLLPAESRGGKPSLISIPRGNVLTSEWRMMQAVILLILMQIVVLILHPLKYGKWIFWIVYFALIFGPLFDLPTVGKNAPTVNEVAFFTFAGHRVLFLGLIGVAFVAAQLWCERRFARLEQ